MAGKLAVVTGASSGIGYNLAKVFAENGYDLVINSVGQRLEKAAGDFDALGVQVTAIQADLATFDGCKEFWQGVEGLDRNIDVVAINAGVGVGGFFSETDLQEEVNLVRLNCESTVHIAKYAVKRMLVQGDGKILITSSIAGEMVAPREAVYAASKAFDLSFGKSLRAELETLKSGITVTVVQPGPTDTDFFNRAGLGNTEAGTKGKSENDPYDVAKQGFDALMKGEEHVYAGNWKVKMEGATSNITPDSVQAAMHNKMARPLDEKEQ